MEVYEVTYKQLSRFGRECFKIGIGEMTQFTKLCSEYGISFDGSNMSAALLMAQHQSNYEPYTRLVALPYPDIALIEPAIRRMVTVSADQAHWLYIDTVKYLGTAIEAEVK